MNCTLWNVDKDKVSSIQIDTLDDILKLCKKHKCPIIIQLGDDIGDRDALVTIYNNYIE
jgi:hypothetical protein